MRKILPAFMGLALALGAAGVSRADDKYKEKSKTSVPTVVVTPRRHDFRAERETSPAVARPH